jgi:hypothetical protein
MKEGQAGFTLMETLWALGLLLICAGAAGGLVFTGVRSVTRVRAVMDDQYRLLRVDGVIRKAAETVCIPYWEPGETGVYTVRAAIETALAGTADEGCLTALDSIRDREGRIRGVTCRYRIGKKEFVTQALFASIPLIGSPR